MHIKSTFYSCGSKFYIDEILDMYVLEHDIEAVVYTDGNECIYYELINKHMKRLAKSSIYLTSQFKNGGQSANRLARIRDIERENYITLLAEEIVDLYYDKENNRQKVKHFIICGPAQFKEELSEHKLIKKFFKNMHVINMADVDQNKIFDAINNFDDPEEKEHLDNIRDLIGTADNRLVFGDQIPIELKECMIGKLYIHVDNKELQNLKLQYKPKIIKIKSGMILEFGGAIGVRYY
jgi:peptide subunit release factor 1 (eRF1)